jgi:excisionase family DNA binding protein
VPQSATASSIDTAEAARRLGITPRTLLYHLHRRAIDACRVGRGYSFDPRDVEEFRFDREAIRQDAGPGGEHSLHTAQVAAILLITPWGVRYHARGGTLPTIKTPGGYRFRLADVLNLRALRRAQWGDPAVIDTAEAARRLGIAPASVRSRVRRWTLDAVPTPRGYRYRPQDIEALRLAREQRIASHGSVRAGIGGAPRGNLNRVTTARSSGRLEPVRRLLPPRSRLVFDFAASAAIRHAAMRHTHRGPHQRHRARLRAVRPVIARTARAWALPARTSDEQHRNLIVALRPWLKRIDRRGRLLP